MSACLLVVSITRIGVPHLLHTSIIAFVGEFIPNTIDLRNQASDQVVGCLPDSCGAGGV